MIKIDQTKLTYWVDIGLAISFILCGLTGIIKFRLFTNYFDFIFRALGIRLISLIHDWSGIVLALLVLVHLIIHWRWLITETKDLFKK